MFFKSVLRFFITKINMEEVNNNTTDVIPCFSNLSKDDRNGIHEVLFQMGILELENENEKL